MKISQRASKGHLIVGSILVMLAVAALIVAFFFETRTATFLVFFFGVWGGVELGRYLENWLAQRFQTS